MTLEKILIELTDLVQRNDNIKSITYEKYKGVWYVTFSNKKTEEVETELLIEFLKNN